MINERHCMFTLFLITSAALYLQYSPEAATENPYRENDTTKNEMSGGGEKIVTPLHILAILTTRAREDEDRVLYPLWTQGKDIILGGRLAEEHINNASDVLEGFEIKIVPVFVPQCNPLKSIDSLVDNMTSENLNIMGVVGMFCDEIVDMYAPLIGHNGSDVIQLVGSFSESKRSGNPPFPHLFNMLPSSESISTAVLECLRELNWTRIGVVKTGGYSITSNYVKLAETFEEMAKRSEFEVVFHYELTFERDSSITALIRALRKSEVNIVVAILPPSFAYSILCIVASEGLVWPEYAWTFVGLDPDDVIHLSSMLCSGDKITNIIFFTLTLDNIQGNLTESGSTGTSYDVFQSFPENSLGNMYADIVYDSVWSLALAVNGSIPKLREKGLSLESYGMGKDGITYIIEDVLLQLKFLGRTGYVELGKNRNRSSMEMVFVNTDDATAGPSTVISWYNLKTGVIKLNQTLLELVSFPLDKFEAITDSFPLPLSIILLLWNGSIFILISFSLFAFIFYRKEPEIKSSSFLLSIPMYLGCYLLLLSAIILAIVGGISRRGTNIFNYSICNVDTIASSIGTDLVIGTLLLRSLRIYFFFRTFHTFTGKKWSDSRLVLWVILIVSVKMLIFILWMFLDINHLIDTKTFQKGRKKNEVPHYLITRSCFSDYIGVWVAVVYSYSCSLLVPLLILLVVCFVTLIVSVGTLWGILRQVGYEVASKAILSTGFSLAALVVQVLLFLPKVIPPLMRCTGLTLAQRSLLLSFKSEE